MKAERVMALAAQVQAARDTLKALENELDALLANTPDNEPTSWSPLVGQAQQIMRLLATRPGEAFDATIIARVLSIPNPNTVRAILSRLCREGQVVRLRRGSYCAPIRQLTPDDLLAPEGRADG